MTEPKTIDNLGPDVHQRYIDDMRLLSDEEVKRIFQTPNVAKRAEILKTAPKYSEIDVLWGVQEKKSSHFEEPEDFVLSADVFTYSIIPSLGSVSEMIQKLESLKKSPDSDVERQRKILLKLASVVQNLNTILRTIINKKDEFHKG